MIKTKRIQHTILCLIPWNITQTVLYQQVTEYQAIGQYRIVIEILIELYPRLIGDSGTSNPTKRLHLPSSKATFIEYQHVQMAFAGLS